MKNQLKILQSSEIVFGFVLIFIMFTTPLVVDVLLCIKFDYDLNTIETKQIETSSHVYAYSKAMLLEFLVMVLLVNGWKRTSIAFTLITGVVSLYFYNQFIFTQGLPKLLIEIIYSFMFPLVTAICSHIYIERKEQEQEQQSKDENNYLNTIEEQKEIIEQSIKTIQQQSNEIEEGLIIIEQQSNYNKSISNRFEDLQETYEYSESVIEEVRTLEDQQRLKNKGLSNIIEQLSKSIEQQQKELKKSKTFEVKYKEVSTCPYCENEFVPSGLNRHKSMCSLNPKNIKETET